jgi:uncharacterized protein (DUF983 family)
MSDSSDIASQSIIPLLLTGLRCRCPRCRVGKVFSKYLKIADRCPECGLGLEGHDTGDGAVVPAMLLIGALVVGMAAYVEFTFTPPLWFHGVVWVPVIIGLTMMILQPLKGISIAMQYKYRSTEEDGRPGGQ